MRYIIMCGGKHIDQNNPKQLFRVKNETFVERTIRLLKENGIKAEDIVISASNPAFTKFGIATVSTISPRQDRWFDAAFPLLDLDPACYIFGDVYFSPAAIKKIIETETDDIEFFASAPPFTETYYKPYAEPFAFKVADKKHFAKALEKTSELFDSGELKRGIAWEIWQVVKGTKLNEIDYTNYTVINDYTCDVDCTRELQELKDKLAAKKHLLKEGEIT